MMQQTHDRIRFGSLRGLPPESLPALVARLQQPLQSANDALHGRAAPTRVTLPPLGPLVIKAYLRGGWLSVFNRRTHLRCRRSRGEREFALLTDLRNLGLNVPEPIAWAEQGHLFVQTWLIMAELPDVQTLAAVAQTDAPRARTLLPATAAAVAALIAHRIHHVDLHPGNVLVDAGDRIVLIDFDKAVRRTGDASRLAARYQRRWNRAVVKHGLPDLLVNTLDPATRP